MLGATFTRERFEAAFEGFRALYNVSPERAACAPDVLARFCELYEFGNVAVHGHSARLRFGSTALSAAILPPGTIAFEGEVDDVRMGDW